VNRKFLSSLALTLFLTPGVVWFIPQEWVPLPANQTGNCDPSYPDVCIKSPPPDLNCHDIPNTDFKVLPLDPHRFDTDGDGIGCETSEPEP
jgi:hypothetical protein